LETVTITFLMIALLYEHHDRTAMRHTVHLIKDTEIHEIKTNDDQSIEFTSLTTGHPYLPWVGSCKFFFTLLC
jgi:hypothetical protein